MWSDPIFINNLVIPIAGMLTGIVLGLPVIKALVRVFEHKVGMRVPGEDQIGPAMHEVRDQLSAFEERIDHRLSDIEERIDFTERVLTQYRDRSALPGSD